MASPTQENPILKPKKYFNMSLSTFLPGLGYKNITRNHENSALVCKICVLAHKMVKIGLFFVTVMASPTKKKTHAIPFPQKPIS